MNDAFVPPASPLGAVDFVGAGGARPRAALSVALAFVLGVILALGAQGAEPALDCVVRGPAGAVAAGEQAEFTFLWINAGPTEATAAVPAHLEVRLSRGALSRELALHATPPGEAHVRVPAGGFARRTYRMAVPADFPPGDAVALTRHPPSRTSIEVCAAEPAPPGEPPTQARALRPVEPLNAGDPVGYFKTHFFPHEPFYFIAGPEAPNAKFQVSIKYQLLAAGTDLAEDLPVLTHVYVGYTQTSLWDWSQPSAPFFDSSYRPEFLFAQEWIARGRWRNWFRLEFQSGLMHESNGRDGLMSRSLNLFYVKPIATLGTADGFQVSLAPRVWTYVGDLSDNPDLDRYRGYADLRTVIGWTKHAQLAAQLRVGDHFDRGSVQLEFTYPMWHLPLFHSSVFFHAQYFHGYGESLLRYNQRDQSYRFGFGLTR